MSAFGFRKPEDLPQTIPVFPLPGALLFPRSVLPLNIFEPRYLNMVDDALGSHRLIGMIQPGDTSGLEMPTLADVGCVGKITNFAETEDGRYLISLTGVARFQVKRELAVQTPYRMVEAAWTHYAADLSQREFGAIDRDSLGQALLAYAETRGFEIDWNAADDAPAEMLVNAVCAACPFDLREKQMLLEAESLIDRCETLVALLHLGVVKPNRNSLQ